MKQVNSASRYHYLWISSLSDNCNGDSPLLYLFIFCRISPAGLIHLYLVYKFYSKIIPVLHSETKTEVRKIKSQSSLICKNKLTLACGLQQLLTMLRNNVFVKFYLNTIIKKNLIQLEILRFKTVIKLRNLYFLCKVNDLVQQSMYQ